MMNAKKLLFISLLTLSTLPLTAQTLAEADNAYRQFIAASNAGNDKAATYNALFNCYNSNLSLLRASAPTSGDYARARANLKDIIPYLPNAAAYMSGNGNKSNAVLFAKAYVDINLMPEFSDMGNTSTAAFAQLAYYASANLVNSRRYAEAIPYLQAYVQSGEEKYRRSVMANLIKACEQTRNRQAGLQAIRMAVAAYPNDFAMLSSAVNFCIDNGDADLLREYVDKALALRPSDETLLNIKGKLLEDSRDYVHSLEIYAQLERTHPNALDVAKHLAIGNYNLGVVNYNQGLQETSADEQKRLRAEASHFFSLAAQHLERVVLADPASLKYTQALAVAYNITGNKERFATVNNKLASMGGGRVSSDYVPTLLTYAGGSEPAQTASVAHGSGTSVSPTGGHLASVAGQTASVDAISIPSFSAFARPYIEERVTKWQNKDPYETVEEYRQRVTEEHREAKIREIKRQAEQEYISNFQGLVDLKQLSLRPYDAEHGAFLIESPVLGQMVLPVPRENNEARNFERNWSGMQFESPQYYIADDHLAVASLTIITPTGKRYDYDNSTARNYTETSVDVHFAPIDNALLASGNSNAGKPQIERQEVHLGTSDVDTDIPESATRNERTFAVVISNENYANVAAVPMALNDGKVFATYCERTLGMPHENVRCYSDASYGTMLRAIRDIKDIARAYQGDIRIVFYYAGHGIPNEATKDAYLLPVDADGTQTEGCYPVSRLYAELGSTQAKSVVVFLDACFSGAQREGGMLASARGVALKAKADRPQGNMVVFSAASGDETAFPYTQQGHGLFTYFLLKKLQESKGEATLGELSQYISENVTRQAVVINRKTQTPTTVPSSTMTAEWQSQTLK